MIWRVVALALAACLLVPLAGVAAAEPPALRADGTVSGITVSQLATGVYQFTASTDGYVDQTNSLVVVTRDGVLVFDTFTRQSTARAALALIRGITDKPVRYVVNSHWHPDHWTGNEVFAEAFPNVEIVASRQTAEYMRDVSPGWIGLFASRRQRLAATRAARTTPLSPELDLEERVRLDFLREITEVHRAFPTRTYEGSMTLHFGGREFRLLSEFGDASYSTLLYLPHERIVAVGDLVVHPVTWTTNSYAISPWIDSLHVVDRMNWSMLVPGHGALQRDRTYLHLLIDFFESTRTQVRNALLAGAVTPEEAYARIDLSQVRSRFGAGNEADFNSTAESLSRKVYQELRDGMVSSR